jgi:hypothetical protein
MPSRPAQRVAARYVRTATRGRTVANQPRNKHSDAAHWADSIAKELARMLPGGKKHRVLGRVEYDNGFISLISGVGRASNGTEFFYAKPAYYAKSAFKPGHGFVMHPRYMRKAIVEDRGGARPRELAQKIMAELRRQPFGSLSVGDESSLDELAYYGLDGLLEGKPATLYHGTTAWFRKFDRSKSRDELVNQFYGSGIFLTPKKSVAGRYANANRNIGFPPEIIKDFKRVDPKGGAFMEALYKKGVSVWDDIDWDSDEADWYREDNTANEITDVAGWIIGSKVKRLKDKGFVNIFSMDSGMPEYIYDRLDHFGLNSLKYRPKVYTVTANVKYPLVTASKSEARKAKSKGYDSVIYTGSDLVDGVPEVAVYDPRKVRIEKVEEW